MLASTCNNYHELSQAIRFSAGCVLASVIYWVTFN